MLSGFVTSLVTNPVDVCRTGIMNEKVLPGQARQYPNLFYTFWKVWNFPTC